MTILPSSEIAYRTDFALLCNARGYRDAVEVGCDLGIFAKEFLDRFAGNWLFLVDPYEPCDEFMVNRSLDAMTAVLALMPHHGRFRFVRHPSPGAIPFVTSLISPEFVYIDGDHREGPAHQDILSWWSILPPHGMIAGHDYDDAHPGVRAAVQRFARDTGAVVRLTHETDCPASWYAYRTEPEELIHKFFRDERSTNPNASTNK